MTCKDCLHYEACKGTYYTAKGCDNIALYDFDGEMYADSGCEDFADRSKWMYWPCKVGDAVYSTYQDPTTCKYSINKREIFLIEFNNNHFYFYATPSICFKDTEFSKSVFLTREEAEKALEGMK